MPEVAINIRCSNGEKFTVQVDLSETILALKQKIATQASVAPELQRLIYKGRVLKEDQKTLAAYTVEADGTIHLVRSMAPATAPAPTASAAPPMSPPSGGGPSGLGSGSASSNPLADMMSSMGAPGGMDINRMQQQLMSNPEMMNSIMNSPMMEALLNNPDMLRNIMFSNPAMQQAVQNNPQLAQVLNDPAMMRQTLEMARNPEAMNQARRSQDLMMSQIENQPGGFNALRRLYTDIQEPMMQASEGIVNNSGSTGAGAGSSNSESTASSANPSTGPNTSALPNPWAPSATAGAPAPGAGTGSGSPGAAGAAGNPWAGLGGAGTGMPGFGGLGQMDPNTMAEMMNNPMIQQMVSQMADNPVIMESMIAQNPALRQALEANPALRAQLPTFMRQMADPQNMQAIAQMQSAMQQLQRAGILPPGMPGMPGVMPGGAGTGTGDAAARSAGLGLGLGLGSLGNPNLGRGTPSTPPAAGGLDFSSLLGATGTGGTGTTAGNPWAAPPGATPAAPTPAAATPAPAAANPEETYATQLTQMNDMGFTDRAACVRALVACQGNVNAAVERLLGGDV